MTNLKYKLKEIVYLKTGLCSEPRIITGIIIRGSGVRYEVSFGDSESAHYEFEICSTKEESLVAI